MTSGRYHRSLDAPGAAATPPVAALSDRACNGVDIAVFFPVDNTGIKAARDICKACPHRQPWLRVHLQADPAGHLRAGRDHSASRAARGSPAVTDLRDQLGAFEDAARRRSS